MSIFDALGAATAAIFYTQQVELYTAKTGRNSYGDRVTVKDQSLGVLACNLQPITNEVAQRDYGVVVAEGWRLSCALDERVVLGVFVVWQGKDYRIKAALPRSSHVEVLIDKE